MSEPKYGVYRETATFPQGGEVMVTLTNVNPINLDPEQRAWLFELVDLFHQYGDPEPDPADGDDPDA